MSPGAPTSGSAPVPALFRDDTTALPTQVASEVTGQVLLSTNFAQRHRGSLVGGTKINHTQNPLPRADFYQRNKTRASVTGGREWCRGQYGNSRLPPVWGNTPEYDACRALGKLK